MINAEISAIAKISGTQIVDISPKDSEVVSLDDRLRDVFSEKSVETQTEYLNIMAKVNDPDFVSSPGGLFELQVRLGEYKQEVELISALSRKAVATAETLLRA